MLDLFVVEIEEHEVKVTAFEWRKIHRVENYQYLSIDELFDSE